MERETEPLITPPTILRAVLQLLERGVAVDDIPLELSRLAPYDADLLDTLMKDVARAA